MALRSARPLTWVFHRNTVRWSHNLLTGDPSASPRPAFKEYLEAPTVALPPPRQSELDLPTLLRRRVSCRRFSASPLSLDIVGTLLWSGYGLFGRSQLGTEELLERPVPSAGGLYPLELYLLALRVDGLSPGVYHYAPVPHMVECLREVGLPEQYLAGLFLGQAYIRGCAAVIVQTAVCERCQLKYEDRGYRYILMETGHVAQNLNLMAVALGVGGFNIGGFFDAELARLLGIDEESEIALYCTAVGAPAQADRATLRQPEDEVTPPAP